MENFTTETRTFVGETATAIGDGWAGFRKGQWYELLVERRANGALVITVQGQAILDSGQIVLSEAEFERWFTPVA